MRTVQGMQVKGFKSVTGKIGRKDGQQIGSSGRHQGQTAKARHQDRQLRQTSGTTPRPIFK